MPLLADAVALHDDLIVHVEYGRPVAQLVAGGRQQSEVAPRLLEVVVDELAAEHRVGGLLLGGEVGGQLAEGAQRGALVAGQELQQLLRGYVQEGLLHTIIIIIMRMGVPLR